MSWKPDTAFVGGLDFFTGVVGRVRDVDWEKPSPCTGWRLLDVLGHVGIAVWFGTQLIRDGKAPWEPVDPPGAAVGASPGEWWTSLLGPAREAVAGADLSQVLDSPWGAAHDWGGAELPRPRPVRTCLGHRARRWD